MGNDLVINQTLLAAYRVASTSLDPSTQNGAVLLDSNWREIGKSSNHFPSGVSEQYWHGEKADKYARVVHAETGALLAAAKRGFSTWDSILVCPWAACSNCAKHIADAGVSKLYRHKWANSGVDTGSHWYDDCAIGDEIMTQAGVEIIEVEPVESDISLRRDGKQWFHHYE